MRVAMNFLGSSSRPAFEAFVTQSDASGVGEFALGFGDGASEALGGFAPLGDDGLRVGDGLLAGDAIGHAAGELGLRQGSSHRPCSRK